jgi:hypothetical protein
VEPLAVRCCWCARRRFCLLDENNKEGGDYPMILYARASKSGQIERGAKGYRLEPTPIGALRECPLYPRKRTLVARVGMSALCQKRTLCTAKKI